MTAQAKDSEGLGSVLSILGMAGTDGKGMQIAAFVFLYSLAHALRIARLISFDLRNPHRNVRLPNAHLLSALPASLLPMPLGELLRISSFAIAKKSIFTGGAIWVVERFLDAIGILIVLILAGILLQDINMHLILILGVFLIGASFGILIFWEFLPFLIKRQLLQSRSALGLNMLRILKSLQTAGRSITYLTDQRMSLLIAISIGVWISEFAAMSVLLKTQVVSAFLEFLSLKMSYGLQFDPRFWILGTMFLTGTAVCIASMMKNKTT